MSDAAIPADDPNRKLTIAERDSPQVRHVAVVGDTYSILVSGAETAGRYCLIDMIVPDGGGPPPHRHDFEEIFTLLEGELEFTFRGETETVRAGSTVNVPANAPHAFRNASRGACAYAVPRVAGGAGRILSRSRRSVGEPHVAAPQARQGANGGADQEDHGACPEIPYGTAGALRIPARQRHHTRLAAWTPHPAGFAGHLLPQGEKGALVRPGVAPYGC